MGLAIKNHRENDETPLNCRLLISFHCFFFVCVSVVQAPSNLEEYEFLFSHDVLF